MIINAADHIDLLDAVADADPGDIVWFDEDQELDASLTIPAGVTLVRERGARIQATSSAIALTVSGDLCADRVALFEGFGDGMVALSNQTIALPEWWGVRDGSGQDHVAINNAILAAMHIGLVGDYFCAGKVLLPYGGYSGNRKKLVALNGRARLFADTAGMTLLHHADSFCGIRGLDLHANNSGVTLFKMMPELEHLNTAVGNQNHNDVDVGLYGGDYGLIMMAGRAIGGTASGCWYNHIKLYATSNGTAVWLKGNGATDPLSSGVNSNDIEGNMNGSIGLGVRIDAGGGNRFRIQQENMTKGILIEDAMANGGDNPNNVFYDYHAENVAIQAEINEPLTKFYNSDLDHSLVIGTAKDTFLDDGRPRTKEVTLTATGGTFTLHPSYNKLKLIEKDGIMHVFGYLQVQSVTGSPTGVVHLPNLPKSCAPGLSSRAGGTVVVNDLNLGSNASACVGRILEGTNILDIFGTHDGNLKYLAPYLRAGSDLTVDITYPVR